MGTDGLGSAWLSDRAICAHLIHAGRYLWAYLQDQYSEVDMMDVLLNRRILVVMIPTLEKSSQEAANLGKLVVSSIRLMMAMNLGHTLEGSYADVIATKATNSPAPYI